MAKIAEMLKILTWRGSIQTKHLRPESLNALFVTG